MSNCNQLKYNALSSMSSGNRQPFVEMVYSRTSFKSLTRSINSRIYIKSQSVDVFYRWSTRLAFERPSPVCPGLVIVLTPLWEDEPMTLDESVHGMRLRVIERAQMHGNVIAVCRELGSRGRSSDGAKGRGATVMSFTTLGRRKCQHRSESGQTRRVRDGRCAHRCILLGTFRRGTERVIDLFARQIENDVSA